MKTWILLQLAALAAVSLAQEDCSKGACYPRVGDLLIGREQQLHASSTCGLNGIEVFCTPYGQWKMQCCPCDSRNPEGRHAHTIQNVLSTAGTNKWWMSRKDASPVSIQFDPGHMFQLENLVMTFKGPRPDALVIERTEDGGHTWKPARYMATNCHSVYPQANTHSPQNLEDVSCYTLSPLPSNPYLDQTIQFNPTRQYSELNFPNSKKIEGVAGFNGLRINLTELGHVPHTPGRSFSRYFALRQLRVMGTCLCHGHANRCLPITYGNQLPNTQVNARCECQHNTVGMNCEHCADLYNDQPWQPAEDNNPRACKLCNCNNHAQRCRFDPARYEATRRQSGGVCVSCLHHTTGPNCERCAPNYYPNPSSSMDRPDACLRCSCNAAGSEDGGQCDHNSGQCRCKANVEGPNCDRCKSGYYGLSASNPLGCSRCDCSTAGSLHGSCDPVTGQCSCRPNVHGLNCDRCASGFWNSPNSPSGCQPCDCHPTNAIGATCDQMTGQCHCRYGFAGRTCSGCPDFTYGDPRTGCRACQCDRQGTASCDQSTGACRCHPGVTGARCDSCARGRCDTFPGCPSCPSCFATLDAQLGSLSLIVQRLSSSLSQLPGSGTIPGNLGLRISALEDALTDIRDQLTLPAPSAAKLDRTLGELTRLREQAERLGGDVSDPWKSTDLQPDLDELQRLLNALNIDYNAKKNALINSVSANDKGALDAIKKAYEDSNSAVKQAEATGKKVRESADLRQDALDLQGEVQPGNTKDLDKLNNLLPTKPNLTPTAVKVCGSKRTEPCTPEKCDGELCSPDAAQSCLRGAKCVGALPTAGKAQRDTEEVKAKLQELRQNITEAGTQMQETQDSANQVRQATEEQAKQIKKARDELEADLQDTRDFVRQLKEFLSDPSADPEQIERVSEEILNAKLPLSMGALKKKLDELQSLAAGLPDSARVLEESQPQLDQARKLLAEAERARDAAVGVKDDVTELLEGLGEVEKSLGEMGEKVKGSVDILERLNPAKIASDLDESVGTLGDVTDTVGNDIPEGLNDLKDLVADNNQQAQTGLDDATDAKDEADAIKTDFVALEDKLDLLRKKAADAGDATEAGATLKKLQDDMGKLIQNTSGIMETLEEKESSIKNAMNHILDKSQRLNGLEAKLHQLIADIRLKAEQHSTCSG